MEHLPGLIADLALILITGAITTILFRRIRQPLVLGYIIAGFLVGPYLSLTPTVSDRENIQIWADIGVIFLLFSLGLEFSFRKLRHIGGSASITAGVEILFILLTGYLLGTAMGWSVMDSIFLGGMLASSSTTIISKAFDELGIKTQKYAGVVIGVLIVEDLIVILLMVLLSTVAATKQIEGTDVLFTILKLLIFLVLWFMGGIFIVPTFLRKAKKLLNEETLLILSVGLCLVMVVIATRVGFSAELGAFIMGSILAETTSAEKIGHLIKPVKDLFGAVFFVSVGMLIDPAAIIEYRYPILWVTLLVLGGKFFSTAAGSLISGQPMKQSIQVGMSMAQVGEFAFIVASLGLSLGVTSDFLFPVAVGVSAITTFTTPYMIRYSPDLYNFIQRKLPPDWISGINNYSSGTQEIQAESEFRKVIKGYIRIVLTNGILVLAIFMLSLQLLLPFIKANIAGPVPSTIIVLVVTLAIASPFLWAIMAKRPGNILIRELWVDRKYNRGPLLILEISRVVIGLLLVGFLTDRLFSAPVALAVGIPVIIIAVILSSKRTKSFHKQLENVFLNNLNAREKTGAQDKKSGDNLREQLQSHPGLEPWDVHLVDLVVNPNAPFTGKPLSELQWRERYGINIIYIKRGEKLIFAPAGTACLQATDHAGVIGTDEQMQIFIAEFEESQKYIPETYATEDIIIQQVALHEQSALNGLSIRGSGIREAVNGIVIGLERNNTRIVNPDSGTVFQTGDIIWIAGERGRINKLIEAKNFALDEIF